jgi:pyruvate ferredoxin oxidoreductase alpha subunit
VIERVDREWGKLTGRYYGGLTECYRCEDSKYIMVGIGSWVGDMRIAVDSLRDEGYPVGLLKLRYVRPFPARRVYEVVKGSRGVVVFDRSISAGSAGPLFLDLASHIHAMRLGVPVKNVVAGLAGVDVGYKDFENIVKRFVEEVEGEGWVREFLEFYPGR